MKKRTINAFTLVEMLIVIVIIGILIAALLPRMQAAQWRARDVSRKTALSQIQSAIVVSQWDKWAWPGMPKNKEWINDDKDPLNWMDVKDIEKQLSAAWLNWIPEDPLNASIKWLWAEGTAWQYRYMVLPRNWTPAWWFILMAKTEVEWWSNRVYCGDAETSLEKWYITPETTDLTEITPCESLFQDPAENGKCWRVEDAENPNTCYYHDDWQLRYIITY